MKNFSSLPYLSYRDYQMSLITPSVCLTTEICSSDFVFQPQVPYTYIHTSVRIHLEKFKINFAEQTPFPIVNLNGLFV